MTLILPSMYSGHTPLIRKMVLHIALFGSVLALSACNTSFLQSAAQQEASALATKQSTLLAELRADPSLQKVTTGNTDDPAPGFERVGAGSEQEFVVDVGREVYFVKGSAKLERSARDTLDLQAAWLKRHPQWHVKLQGHADDPVNSLTKAEIREAVKRTGFFGFGGSLRDDERKRMEANKKVAGLFALSDKRANAVKDYLVSRGVSPDRIDTQGYGRLLPVRDCPENSCKVLNRRVVSSLRRNSAPFVSPQQASSF